MSLESFFGLEEGETSGSKEASEKFREQMRKNAKAIKAMAKHQKKQSAQEEQLAKLLVAFLQDPTKKEAVFFVVKLLQDNVPGAFILAILSLSDIKLQEAIKENLKALTSTKKLIGPPEKAIINFGGDGILTENIKEELNEWGELIYKAGALLPHKTLNTVLTSDYKLKSIILDLIDYSLSEYFKRHAIEISQEKIRQFALLSIQSVLLKLRDMAQKTTDTELMEQDGEEQM